LQQNLNDSTNSGSNGLNPQSFIETTPDDKFSKKNQNGYMTKQIGLDDPKYRPNFITNLNDEMDE
jgi:hypothetical protein